MKRYTFVLKARFLLVGLSDIGYLGHIVFVSVEEGQHLGYDVAEEDGGSIHSDPDEDGWCLVVLLREESVATGPGHKETDAQETRQEMELILFLSRSSETVGREERHDQGRQNEDVDVDHGNDDADVVMVTSLADERHASDLGNFIGRINTRWVKDQPLSHQDDLSAKQDAEQHDVHRETVEDGLGGNVASSHEAGADGLGYQDSVDNRVGEAGHPALDATCRLNRGHHVPDVVEVHQDDSDGQHGHQERVGALEDGGIASYDDDKDGSDAEESDNSSYDQHNDTPGLHVGTPCPARSLGFRYGCWAFGEGRRTFRWSIDGLISSFIVKIGHTVFHGQFSTYPLTNLWR